MNKLWIKLICAFLGGGAVGYFVGKKIADKYWVEEYNFQNQAFKNTLKYYEGESDETAEENDISEDYHDYSSVIPEDKPDLETLAAKYNDISEHPEDDEPDEPYILTEEEFETDNGNHYILKYYIEDDTLTDENDTLIHEVDLFVGDCLNAFGDDQDVIFVKNPRSNSSYEISKIEGSYEEIVLGIQPTDESSKMRRRRMRDE